MSDKIREHPAVKCQKAFEAKTADYYEGDFTKAESGEYVSPQQQDDFVLFMSGYQAAHEEAKARVESMQRWIDFHNERADKAEAQLEEAMALVTELVERIKSTKGFGQALSGCISGDGDPLVTKAQQFLGEKE